MINPSFRELSKISDSRYEICVLTAKRARRIVLGSKKLMDTKAVKPVTIALDEIVHGKVHKKVED